MPGSVRPYGASAAPDPYGEFLREDELAALIDAKTRLRQIEWLDAHDWRYERNAASRPIVGRVYMPG